MKLVLVVADLFIAALTANSGHLELALIIAAVGVSSFLDDGSAPEGKK